TARRGFVPLGLSSGNTPKIDSISFVNSARRALAPYVSPVVVGRDRREGREHRAGVVGGGHANVDDKLYNPPVALGMFYRWKPRNICELCRKNGVKPKLHMSVLERVAHGTEDYWPGDLPPGAGVVFTEPTNGQALFCNGAPLISNESSRRSRQRMKRVMTTDRNHGQRAAERARPGRCRRGLDDLRSGDGSGPRQHTRPVPCRAAAFDMCSSPARLSSTMGRSWQVCIRDEPSGEVQVPDCRLDAAIQRARRR